MPKFSKRFVSVLVIFSFIVMLQTTAKPLHAGTAVPAQTEKSLSNNASDAGALEQPARAEKARKKHPLLPILIGVAVAGVVATALLLLVFNKYNPHIDPADFVNGVDNPYMPLVPGTTYHYRTTSDLGVEEVTVTTTHDTKLIMGVTCMVVHDVVTMAGVVTEDTWDWYAQDDDGYVWYFGEDTKKFEDGAWSTEGSWEAGVGGAEPGIVMYGDPQDHIGEVYRQEYLKDVAEDRAEILSVTETAIVAYGSFTNCLMTKDYTLLEPDVIEHKYFAPGIGPVLVVTVQGGNEREELVSITSE